MPVHGGGAWLPQALASIPSRAEAGLIEVIVNDSTPCESREEVIRVHSERLDIRYAYMPEIPSWTRKTNLGVDQSRASHVCTLHQDDLWLPDRAAIAREMIEAHPAAAILLTPARIIGSEGEILGQWKLPYRDGEIEPTEIQDALLVQNFVPMPAPIFRRDAYVAVGGMDEGLWYTPDWDLWLKLAKRGPVVCDARPATAFRIHKASQTMTGDRADFARQLEIVLDRHMHPGCKIERISRASLRINQLLSDASRGSRGALLKALITLVKLGPLAGARYIRYSRIHERVLPRLRQRLRGMI